MRHHRKMLGILLLVAAAIAGNANFASAGQGRMQGPPEGGLGFLKRAISEAGASALSSEQESQITALITAFRSANAPEPNEELKTARDAYEAAILAGDLAAAQAKAATISEFVAAHNKTRMQAAAKFEIEVLAILKSGGQLDALKAKFEDRLVRIAGSLAGPPIGNGAGGPGGFMRGPRPSER